MKPPRPHRRALTVATLVLLAGIVTSIAGNLQAINLDNARPGVGAYISAMFWPIILFGMIELLLHTPWTTNWRDAWTKTIGVLLVGFVAAWISYFHMAHVLADYGYDDLSSYVGPLAVDAAMATATLALNRVGQARRAMTAGRIEHAPVADRAAAVTWPTPSPVVTAPEPTEPPVRVEPPAPLPDPVPAEPPVEPAPPESPPDSAGQRRTPERPAVKARKAVPAADPTSVRARAEDDVVALLRAGKDAPTAKALGAAYSKSEEWGRLRLVAARARLAASEDDHDRHGLSVVR